MANSSSTSLDVPPPPHLAHISSNLPSPFWSSLAGKVVMVTGASSGIGRELCLNLAKAECLVVAAARRIDRLVSLCEEINSASGSSSAAASSSSSSRGCSGRAVAVELDVSAGSSSIEASVQRAWDAFGRIDALVNNAGIRGDVLSPLDWSEEEWDRNIGTNLTGLWLVSKHVCRCMLEAKQKGSVINISSIGGLERGHLPGGLPYNASKTAVNAVTKVMALELAPFNIRVNSIAPGLFPSEITGGLLKKEWLNKVTERTVPLRTSGSIDPALTSLIRYLIHESSEYVTGNIFIADAGVTLAGVPIFSSL